MKSAKVARREERRNIKNLLLDDVAWEDIPALLKRQEESWVEEVEESISHAQEMDDYERGWDDIPSLLSEEEREWTQEVMKSLSQDEEETEDYEKGWNLSLYFK